MGWGLRDRVEAVRRSEHVSGAGHTMGALLRVARDVILLLRDLVTDRRVPALPAWGPVAFAVGYMLAPLDIVPDDWPAIGHLDDAIVLGWAARRYLRAAGYELIYEHWRGTDEGLAVVLTLAGVEH